MIKKGISQMEKPWMLCNLHPKLYGNQAKKPSLRPANVASFGWVGFQEKILTLEGEVSTLASRCYIVVIMKKMFLLHCIMTSESFMVIIQHVGISFIKSYFIMDTLHGGDILFQTRCKNGIQIGRSGGDWGVSNFYRFWWWENKG